VKNAVATLVASALLLSACATLGGGRHTSSDDNLAWKQFKGIETASASGGLMIVRADPLVTPVELINAPLDDSSVAAVAQKAGVEVAINASMFAQDYATSIGYMRNFDTINNSHIASKLQGFLLLHPKSPNLPAAKIGTRADLDSYDTVVQTYRMWTAEDGILWNKGSSIYIQVALLGVDDKNRVLFFYHPNLVDVHDLVEQILALPLNLQGLLYLDGGHHGSLYLSRDLGRGWNTGIYLPNLLGIRTQ
jgi:hypothetical protein